jgi:hypothetical protein
MASTYSDSLRLELIGDGEQSGAWGVTTNRNLGTLLEAAISGVASVTHDDSANYSLTALNGVSDEARNMIQEIGGTLTTARNVVVPDDTKLYIVKNATSGGFSITVKTSAGTGVTISNGKTAIVYSDGTNVVEIVTAGDLASLDAVGTSQIDDNAITNAKVADDAIDTAELADGAVDADRLANNAVTTAKIADDNVTTAKIADSNVTTAKIADSNVTTAKIADSNVTTAKIADDNVTYAKLASAAIATASNIRASASSVVVTPNGIESAAAEVTLTDASTINVDWDSGINFAVTLGGNRTLGFPTNLQPGTWRRITVTQDGTGSRTLAFTETGYHAVGGTAPSISSGANDVSVVLLYCRSGSVVEVYEGGADMTQIS